MTRSKQLLSARRLPRVCTVLLTGGSLLMTAVSLAETGSRDPNLADVVRSSYERSPGLALPAAMRQKGEAIRRQASSLLADNPALLVRHENDTVGSDDGYRHWEGGVDLPMWLPGQRDRRSRVAEAAESEAGAFQSYQMWRVSGEVRELVWSLYIAEAEQKLARQALEKASALETDLDKRVAAGELPRTDLLLSRQETLNREAMRIQSEADYNSLLQQYRLVSGLAHLPQDILESLSTMESIGDDHPALVAARLASERMRAERDQVRGEKYANPSLFVGGRSEKDASGSSYDNALIVEVNLPLGSSGQAAPDRAEAELRLSEALSELAEVRRELDSSLNDARTELRRTQSAVELSRQQEQLAHEGWRLTRRSFDLGETDVFTLLQAGIEMLESQHDYRISKLEHGRAVSRYNQAVGVIPE